MRMFFVLLLLFILLFSAVYTFSYNYYTINMIIINYCVYQINNIVTFFAGNLEHYQWNILLIQNQVMYLFFCH